MDAQAISTLAVLAEALVAAPERAPDFVRMGRERQATYGETYKATIDRLEAAFARGTVTRALKFLHEQDRTGPESADALAHFLVREAVESRRAAAARRRVNSAVTAARRCRPARRSSPLP